MDSCMTSPRCPVMVNCLPPRIRVASMKMMSPPTGVQTSPTATPGRLTRSSTSFSVPKFRTEKEVEERVKRPGVAVGLVWTPVGGDIIFIEATRMRGGKQFTMTGHLGEVMQESMTAALTWTRANGERYGIDPD